MSSFRYVSTGFGPTSSEVGMFEPVTTTSSIVTPERPDAGGIARHHRCKRRILREPAQAGVAHIARTMQQQWLQKNRLRTHTHDDVLGLLETADVSDVGVGAIGIGIGAAVAADPFGCIRLHPELQVVQWWACAPP